MNGFSVIPKKRKQQPSDVLNLSTSGEAANAEEVNQQASLYSPHIRPASFPGELGMGSLNAAAAETASARAQAKDVTPPPRGLYTVLKFGGSSMGSAQRLAHVLDSISQQIMKSERATFPSGGASGTTQTKTLRGRVAVVVSAGGNATDWLLDAAEHAAAGELDQALALIDRVAETAITNAFAATAIPSTVPAISSDRNEGSSSTSNCSAFCNDKLSGMHAFDRLAFIA